MERTEELGPVEIGPTLGQGAMQAFCKSEEALRDMSQAGKDNKAFVAAHKRNRQAAGVLRDLLAKILDYEI